MLPVILFHAGVETFRGGFVGVDVFFVISGYLITTIILDEIRDGRFSVSNFYERRARRILPALFLVMFVSIPFAWLWLPYADMKGFSQSLVAVSTFSSNILFWLQSGYFDTGADLKPLLHTWSLAVEEQYYILFPILLMLSWQFGLRLTLMLLAMLGVASFALAEWASVAEPAAAFYLLPTRGWELMIGASAACFLSRPIPITVSGKVREVVGSTGLLLILLSVFTYSKATPFPGVYALMPTLGTLLIILFVNQDTFIGKCVGSRVFMAIGLVSYSAYLWHQPLLSLTRHRYSEELSGPVIAMLLALTFLLSYCSWRYVEAPFRNKTKVSRGLVFSFAIFGAAFFAAIGYFGHVSNGFAKEPPGPTIARQVLTNEDFIVLGDSHGQHLISGLSSATTGTVTDHTGPGCIPFRNVDRYDYRFVPGDCAARVNGYLDRIVNEDPVATVVLSSMGAVYLEGSTFNGKDAARVTGLGVELISDRSIKDRWKVFEIGMRTTLTELSDLKNAKVVFAIDVPELGIDHGCANQQKELRLFAFRLPDLVSESNVDECFVSRLAYEQRVRRYRELVYRVAADFPYVDVFDPAAVFCDREKCKGFDPTYGLLYRDFDHLSDAGSLLYAKGLIEFLGAR